MKHYILGFVLLVGVSVVGQTTKHIVKDIYTVDYSEDYEQPIKLTYVVKCPYGDASRDGLDFYKESGYKTSDNADYANNEWDKGHMAPAADFNCDRETVKKTFSYLNCALQHEGLNRGPWKELERFERDLAKVYKVVNVEILVNFTKPIKRVPAGAAIPTSFTKIIKYGNNTIKFTFPNTNVAGQDWGNFIVNN